LLGVSHGATRLYYAAELRNEKFTARERRFIKLYQFLSAFLTLNREIMNPEHEQLQNILYHWNYLRLFERRERDLGLDFFLVSKL